MATTALAPKNKSATARLVDEFVLATTLAGFRFSSRTHGGDYVVEVAKVFDAGDTAGYMVTERDAYDVLGMVPTVTYGSTWGSDSGSVGGHAALTTGRFHMCKSGVSKRFGAALAKAARV